MGALTLAVVLSLRKARTRFPGGHRDPQHGRQGPGSLGPFPRRCGGCGGPHGPRQRVSHLRTFPPRWAQPRAPPWVAPLLFSGPRFLCQVHPVMQSRRERHRCAPCECDPGYVSAPATAPSGRPPVRVACFRGRLPRLPGEPRGLQLKPATSGWGRRGQGTHRSCLRMRDWGGRAPTSSASSRTGTLRPRPCLGAPAPPGEAPRPGPATGASLARSPGREGTDGTTHPSGVPVPTSKKSVRSRRGSGSGSSVLRLLTGDSVTHRGNARAPSASSRV